MFLGADRVNELHELSQPTEEGVLVGSGRMKARLRLNVKCRYKIICDVICTTIDIISFSYEYEGNVSDTL